MKITKHNISKRRKNIGDIYIHHGRNHLYRKYEDGYCSKEEYDKESNIVCRQTIKGKWKVPEILTQEYYEGDDYEFHGWGWEDEYGNYVCDYEYDILEYLDYDKFHNPIKVMAIGR